MYHKVHITAQLKDTLSVQCFLLFFSPAAVSGFTRSVPPKWLIISVTRLLGF